MKTITLNKIRKVFAKKSTVCKFEKCLLEGPVGKCAANGCPVKVLLGDLWGIFVDRYNGPFDKNSEIIKLGRAMWNEEIVEIGICSADERAQRTKYTVNASTDRRTVSCDFVFCERKLFGWGLVKSDEKNKREPNLKIYTCSNIQKLEDQIDKIAKTDMTISNMDREGIQNINYFCSRCE